jgi:magnesium transporter
MIFSAMVPLFREVQHCVSRSASHNTRLFTACKRNVSVTDETQQFHDQLVAALQAQDDAALASVLSNAHAADIAESFNLLDDEARSRLFFALPPHTAAEVMTLLDESVRTDVVEDLDTASLTEIVANLAPDDAADVLAELPEAEADLILDKLVDEQSDKIEELMEYDEQTAGGIMTPDVVAVPATATVAEAVEQVRQASPDEDLYDIFVVDSERHPVGTVALRRLVTARSHARLADMAEPDPLVVKVDDDQETVVQLIRKYDVSEAAVVDREGRLVGRITHDDLLDVAEEEATEDLYRMAGTDAAELETSSVLRAARVRLTWLLPCMVGMMLSASVLGLSKTAFDAVLFGALVLFVPMIGAMGGNSGIQTATVIVRGFAMGDLASTRISRIFAREGRIALAMAPVSGFVAWGLAALFLPILQRLGHSSEHVHHPGRVALAVGVAMTSAIMVAAGLGIGLPFTFRKLGVDPAIASGPLVTTLNDVISVSIYMTVAILIAR